MNKAHQAKIIAAYNEYERNIIRKRQAEGIEKAKANGVYTKTKKINPDKIRQLRSEGIGATEICRRLRCSRTSVYNALG
jgi:DNA invertase Pin-like site-specific DNA recombinase